MSQTPDLLKAIRSGQLQDVLAALDAGAPLDADDGMPFGIACFMGFADIVWELALRGARVNHPDNAAPTAPLALAVRGGRSEVVKLLIILGAEVPPGMATGLSEADLAVARWKAQHLSAEKSKPGWHAVEGITEVEEIQMVRAHGTDTGVLDEDIRRAVRLMDKKPPR